MKSIIKYSIFVFVLGFVVISCKKEPEVISGCTDPIGDNYNADATVDNSTCTYQKRFLGEYAGEFDCAGAFMTVFTMADMSITELVTKDQVNLIIQTNIGPLPVLGSLSKSQITVDATLSDLSIKPSDIIAGASEDPIKADGTVKTVLTISDDNKTLTGDLNISLVTKEPTVIAGFPIPAGFTLSDVCGFVGTKK